MKQKLRVFALNRKLYDIKKDKLREGGAGYNNVKITGTLLARCGKVLLRGIFDAPFP